MKLIFGDLAGKADAADELRRQAECEKSISQAMRTMMTCEKIPHRDLVRRYGAEAVDEAKRRLKP